MTKPVPEDCSISANTNGSKESDLGINRRSKRPGRAPKAKKQASGFVAREIANDGQFSDGSHYEKRIDAKGHVLSDECIEDEIPFEVPEGWEWVRLCELAYFAGGKTPSTDDRSNFAENGILWVTSKDMKRDFIDSTLITLSEKGASDLILFEPGTLLMVTRSGILRRLLPVAMLKRPATVNQDQKAICPYSVSISPWLLTYLKASDSFIRKKYSKSGTTVESIVFDKVKSMLVPLPPLAEQCRIVERVEELIPLVDEYGNLEEAREALDSELPEHLRKSVLQQAVQGRLVPQDPSDEPASILLEHIRERRAKLVAEKKAKPPKGGESVIYRASDGGHYEKRIDAKGHVLSDELIEDEIPFEIPESWEWARLGTVCEFFGGATPDKTNPKYWDGNIPWASMKDIHGSVLTGTIDSITEAGLNSKPSISICNPGQLIVSTRLAPGKAIISSIKCAINQDLKVVDSTLDVFYLSYWFESRQQYFRLIGSGTTVPGIRLSDLNGALIPIPPLAEQRRIADKVRECLAVQ